ncbi:hypothetical protein N9L68_04290 [bacterium]|nr:hypothetical protein [bacterium]
MVPFGLKIWVSEVKCMSFTDDDFEMAVQAFRKSGHAGAKYARRWAVLSDVLLRRQNQGVYDKDDDVFYTYVALDIEDVAVKRRSGEWLTAESKHHTTIAYLPGMSQRQRDELAQGLKDTMECWIDTRDAPRLRHICLLHFRKCVVYSNEQSYCKDRLRRLVTFARQCRLSWDCASSCSARCPTRVWTSSTQRVVSAPIGMAVGFDSDGRQPPITMQVSEGGVSVNSEIFTLLYYLRERLIYRFGVFHVEGRVGLHHQAIWHVTPQKNSFKQREMVQCWRVCDEMGRWLDSLNTEMA